MECECDSDSEENPVHLIMQCSVRSLKSTQLLQIGEISKNVRSLYVQNLVKLVYLAGKSMESVDINDIAKLWIISGRILV